jgi:hypothetical protein
MLKPEIQRVKQVHHRQDQEKKDGGGPGAFPEKAGALRPQGDKREEKTRKNKNKQNHVGKNDNYVKFHSNFLHIPIL